MLFLMAGLKGTSCVYYCGRFTRDLCSYTTMLSAYVNASDMDGAEKFFRRIKQDGLQPNVVTYGTLIKGYAKINNSEKMIEKYEEMRICGIKASQTIFTTIMDAYGKSRDFGSAVDWFKEMGSSGFHPDQKAKNVLLSLAKTAEEKVEAKQLIEDCNHNVSEEMLDKFPKFVEDDDNDGNEDADIYNFNGEVENVGSRDEQNEGILHALSFDDL